MLWVYGHDKYLILVCGSFLKLLKIKINKHNKLIFFIVKNKYNIASDYTSSNHIKDDNEEFTVGSTKKPTQQFWCRLELILILN